MEDFRTDEEYALAADAADPLSHLRDEFHIPQSVGSSSCQTPPVSDAQARAGSENRSEVIYFAGNSLGLQPKGVRGALRQELDDWARLGVDAHFEGTNPWYSYHESVRETGARMLGARPGEVVMMNSLTVNLHLMLVTFYRPTRQRFKIIMEAPAFPSDTYAIKSQLCFHGHDPQQALLVVEPRPQEDLIRYEDLDELLDREGEQIAVVLLSGVNFFTGQLLDIPRITAAAKRHGCIVGFDLAHAAGNVELALHDWQVDFAVWCNYKYLNGGPGAVGGCFVHESHGRNANLQRFAGWWGNDPNTRFQMQGVPDFIPQSGAEGWQISNPPIFALTPVKVSYDMFDRVGIGPLRRKSRHLTGYLQFLVDQIEGDRFDVMTPREPSDRGCQLSLRVHDRPKDLLGHLQAEGVVCDFRAPNVIRVAPVPLYNRFHEVWRFVQVLAKHSRSR